MTDRGHNTAEGLLRAQVISIVAVTAVALVGAVIVTRGSEDVTEPAAVSPIVVQQRSAPVIPDTPIAAPSVPLPAPTASSSPVGIPVSAVPTPWGPHMRLGDFVLGGPFDPKTLDAPETHEAAATLREALAALPFDAPPTVRCDAKQCQAEGFTPASAGTPEQITKMIEHHFNAPDTAKALREAPSSFSIAENAAGRLHLQMAILRP